METVNCIIIDDEPLARDLLMTYCDQLPYVNVGGVCKNALEAKAVLQQQNVDILFLDVQLPVLNGLAFLATVKNPPQVIMTTAYKEYAVNAFDLSVCDYLVKPFSLERFIVAVDKAVEKLGKGRCSSTIPSKKSNNDLFIKADGKIFRISVDDVLYAEAGGNSSKLITLTGPLVVATTFSNIERMLAAEGFIKVHRSFIVNKIKINRIEGNRIFIGDDEVPIGRNYRESFFNSLGLS